MKDANQTSSRSQGVGFLGRRMSRRTNNQPIKIMESTIQKALKWFEENDVPAYEDDESIYVQAGRDADVQISTAEIEYRASLQVSESQS